MKQKTSGMFVLIIAIAFLGAVVYFSGMFGGTPAVTQTALVEQTAAVQEAALESYQCPDTDLTNLTINFMNSEDTSTSTELSSTWYFYKIVNGVVSSDAFNSLTNALDTKIELPCGEDWMGQVLSDDSFGGYSDFANSNVLSVSGDASASVKDGNVYFTTKGSSMTLTANGKQHGTLQFQGYDEQQKAYLNKAGATDSTAYQDTPANLESSTDSTALAVGTQGQIELTINYRTNATKQEFNDRGYYISINASSSIYDTPTVRLDDAELTNIKGSLDEYCTRSYSGEEYVYLAERDVPNNDKGQLYLSMFALSGVDPGANDDISLTWHGIGTYTSISGSGVLKVGACTDAASTGDVWTLQRVNVDVS